MIGETESNEATDPQAPPKDLLASSHLYVKLPESYHVGHPLFNQD